jgi:hypothetical protein
MGGGIWWSIWRSLLPLLRIMWAGNHAELIYSAFCVLLNLDERKLQHISKLTQSISHCSKKSTVSQSMRHFESKGIFNAQYGFSENKDYYTSQMSKLYLKTMFFGCLTWSTRRFNWYWILRAREQGIRLRTKMKKWIIKSRQRRHKTEAYHQMSSSFFRARRRAG